MPHNTEIAVRHSLTVPIPPAKAFALFTSRMIEFWPKDHSIAESDMADVVIEPRAGGRWFERGVDGTECDWGRVAEWSPPGRVVLLWQITADWEFDPAFETEVELDFNPDGEGTRVDFAHRHLERFGDKASLMRDVFGTDPGWIHTLDAFAALAR